MTTIAYQTRSLFLNIANLNKTIINFQIFISNTVDSLSSGGL
jgi:hypothetical protein